MGKKSSVSTLCFILISFSPILVSAQTCNKAAATFKPKVQDKLINIGTGNRVTDLLLRHLLLLLRSYALRFLFTFASGENGSWKPLNLVRAVCFSHGHVTKLASHATRTGHSLFSSPLFHMERFTVQEYFECPQYFEC